MRRELYTYEVNPLVVRAGSTTPIVIRPRYAHGAFEESRDYAVRLIGMEGQGEQTSTARPSGGALTCIFTFGAEGEYRLLLELPEAGKRAQPQIDLYALEEDLFTLTPFKGDFHMHTFRSDGVESPAYVAASNRKIGMDFIAITDHGRYAPSLEAIAALRELPTDFRVYPGEEVHPPENPLHIINFGGSFSINQLFEDKEAYYEGVRTLEKEITPLPEDTLTYQYASSAWCYNQIRQAGGVGVFVHPYWVFQDRYNVPEALIARLFAEQPFDAFELIGGFTLSEVESNGLQVARYHEERARGHPIPIVGASDAHGIHRGDLVNWYYTILFAPSTTLGDIASAIRGLRSVAVEALPDQVVHLHGPFRLVKYAHFLMREVFPQHDALCQAEGSLLLAALAGEKEAIPELTRLKGQVQKLYHHLWGRMP